MANTFHLRLDLDKQSPMQVVRIRQGDRDGTTIRADLYDHGTAYTIPQAMKGIYFVMRLPDGEHYYRKATDGGGTTYVTVTIDEVEAGSVTGSTALAYFQLVTNDSARLSTSSFEVVVLPDAMDGAQPTS